MGSKLYYSHRFSEVGGKPTWARDTSHNVMRGRWDSRKPLSPWVNVRSSYGRRRCECYRIVWQTIRRWGNKRGLARGGGGGSFWWQGPLDQNDQQLQSKDDEGFRKHGVV